MSVNRIVPLEPSKALKTRVYEALRDLIGHMDIYSSEEPIRLDERALGERLGVSRTPVREAISRLEQEGLVQNIARRGAFVVRKTKAEILDIVDVWAALESMAARLATSRASDEEIAELRAKFSTYDGEEARAHIDEYSDTNIDFHQTIIRLGKSELITQMSDQLFFHMRAIRASTIKDRDRVLQSVMDHVRIIEAIEERDAFRAEQLVRDHALELAEHIERYVDYLR
ncbi:MAG: GntR family transcriptional regulator [Gammaproteobacteria bacterium]|nr:GntR family transcriptional regulator [Gammaproteobacteria bacterium]MDH3448493.1 GntR family transcriptional regulator [Gammaproteobacteria bacterium]